MPFSAAFLKAASYTVFIEPQSPVGTWSVRESNPVF